MSEVEAHECVPTVLEQSKFDYVDDAEEWVDMGNGGIEAKYECPECGSHVALHFSHEAHYEREDGEWVEVDPF